MHGSDPSTLLTIYLGSDYSYGTVNGFFVAILTALTSVLSYAKLPYYAYLFLK